MFETKKIYYASGWFGNELCSAPVFIPFSYRGTINWDGHDAKTKAISFGDELDKLKAGIVIETESALLSRLTDNEKQFYFGLELDDDKKIKKWPVYNNRHLIIRDFSLILENP